MRIAAQWFAVFALLVSFAAVSAAANLKPVPLTSGVAKISAQNTKIEFVGTHSGEKPDPRSGGFGKFAGQITVDPAAKTLKAIVVDIDTTSLYTPIPKLTDHLKTADFFEVREYPVAKFESTKIAAGKGGVAQVTGKLTLHGVTKEITFPANVQITDQGLTLASEFSLDRSQFGMTYGAGKVDDKVMLTVVVGESAPVK